MTGIGSAEMTKDHYADAGLYYLPIERIDEPEFACCKDGRWVLATFGPELRNPACVTIYWEPRAEIWMDFEGGSYQQKHLISFFPAALQPIGAHVAIECAVTYLGGYEVTGMEGMNAHEVFLDLGAGRTLESTVTVRHPIRRTPHGEAL